MTAPFLMDDPAVASKFPADAVARAQKLLAAFKGGVGAYTDSRGNPAVREDIAKFIAERDGHPSDPNLIFLTDGASVAVRLCLNAILRNDRDGILVPIPQYPLYSASIQLYGGALLPYYLDEGAGWGMSTGALKTAIDASRNAGKAVRGLVFINPGNPTGQVMSAEQLSDLCKLAYHEKIVLMADEVYQVRRVTRCMTRV